MFDCKEKSILKGDYLIINDSKISLKIIKGSTIDLVYIHKISDYVAYQAKYVSINRCMYHLRHDNIENPNLLSLFKAEHMLFTCDYEEDSKFLKKLHLFSNVKNISINYHDNLDYSKLPNNVNCIHVYLDGYTENSVLYFGTENVCIDVQQLIIPIFKFSNKVKNIYIKGIPNYIKELLYYHDFEDYNIIIQ